ncbi:hypothetical protein KL930_005227 [Ogataea haglerorum]|uniref:WLM domain-containing protein n=1 Tax=Ogataea haglerorum TaxID=1937702 RepID=A0AAN6D1T5_9ASCO|nr:hypothetical protein KL915_005147 [Ogataea haglerorum]KAG7702348.1 hypothetical protein KL914_005277 [Ogataea haglerorum]KAG7702426.1 hypothetical protein KL950_005241 [Ogataea haglerorum]KAG7713229.1 hypothetical protein KL913_005210 [Ogataea haglerorum]KAG7713490.1 hypothetical protein KL949_005239 [Ogataea haglerorum]
MTVTSVIDKIAPLLRQKDNKLAHERLQKIALEVAPVMRSFGFKVGVLCEFFPKNPQLLGLNVNFGTKICLRLRYPHASDQFLPLEDVIETMLHELCHNKYGPHDNNFYRLLDQLRDKYHSIKRNGALKETGYVAESQVLGGRKTGLIREMRLKKLGQVKYVAKVEKLGSNMPKQNKSMRELMLEAAERRAMDAKTCTVDPEAVPNEDELVEVDKPVPEVIEIPDED